jgi:hypothetical protein
MRREQGVGSNFCSNRTPGRVTSERDRHRQRQQGSWNSLVLVRLSPKGELHRGTWDEGRRTSLCRLPRANCNMVDDAGSSQIPLLPSASSLGRIAVASERCQVDVVFQCPVVTVSALPRSFLQLECPMTGPHQGPWPHQCLQHGGHGGAAGTQNGAQVALGLHDASSPPEFVVESNTRLAHAF